MFEPYLLVPFLFAVNILLLEIGIASRRPALLRWMMAAPLGLLLLSTWTFSIPESINLRRMLLDCMRLLAAVSYARGRDGPLRRGPRCAACRMPSIG